MRFKELKEEVDVFVDVNVFVELIYIGGCFVDIRVIDY